MKHSNGAVPIALALIAGAMYGAGGAVSQLVAAHGFNVVNITCAQFIGAVVLLGIVCLVARYRLPSAVVGLKLGLVGVCNAATTMTYYLAIDRLSVGCAVAFQFQYVWIALVFSCLATRSRPNIRSAICAALVIPGSLLGSGVIDEALSGQVNFDAIGIVIACACAVFYALYMHLNARIELDYPPLQRTFFQMLGGMVAVLIATPFMSPQPMGLDIAPYGLLMGLIMSVIPCGCLAAASVKLSGSMVAILTSSELPVAILVGVLVLSEPITPLRIVGAVVICGAIAFSNTRSAGEETHVKPVLSESGLQ